MTTKTLDSVIKLLAISLNKQSEDSAKLLMDRFSKFLEKYVEDKYFYANILKFENSLSSFSSYQSAKKTALNSVRIIRVCEELKEDLSLLERVEVIFYLLELANDLESDLQSIDFIILVSDLFGVSKETIQNLKNLISNIDIQNFSSIKYEENIIAVLYISDSGLLFVKPLVIGFKSDGRNVLKDSVSPIFKETVLCFNDVKKFFYPELITLLKKNHTQDSFKLILSEISLKKKKNILLHNLSLTLNSGELIGIIGKSGSGKTSLLRCISGHETGYSGSVSFSKENNPDLLQKSFVPQHDFFIPLFNIEEHLQQRCNFLQIPMVMQSTIIDGVLKITDLDKDRGKKVCKIDGSPFEVSGGQQKRLSIAMELFAEPDLLILDEPTSGLSSEDAVKIVSLLKSIAANNKIVIASIHQPDFDIFSMFDKIILIDEGGFPIYFGTPLNAVDYFREKTGKINKNSLVETRYSPSILLKLIEEKKYDEKGQEFKVRFVKPIEYYNWFRSDYLPIIADVETSKSVKLKQNYFLSFVNQFKLNNKIDLKLKYRLALQILIPLITGVLFSFIARYSDTAEYTYYYNPNVPVWILIILITSIFIGLVSTGHEFIQLRNFHQNENKIVNKSFSFTTMLIVRYFCLTAIQSVFLVLPSVYIIENSFHFYSLFLISFCLIYWGSLAGLLLSKFLKENSLVYLAIPLIIIPQLVFSGALIRFGDFNKLIGDKEDVPLIASFSPARWATEAVLVDFYTDNPYYRELYFNRQILYNAVYYNDYFLPEVEAIQSKDKIRASKIIDNECEKIGFISNAASTRYDCEVIKKYFDIQIKTCLDYEDSAINSDKNHFKNVCKYSNLAVAKVINNSVSSRNLLVYDDNIERNYKPIYMLPQHRTRCNSLFFRSFVNVGERFFNTFYYNLLVIGIYNFLLIIILLLSNMFESVKLKYK